jgi:integrase
MARIVGRLTARKVATANPPRGRQWAVIPDGGNLLLQVSAGAQGRVNKSWLFKYQLGFRRREMGLGPYPDVSLAEARQKAHELRAQLREGVDPLEAKHEHRRALLAERARTVSFRECAEMYIRLHGPGWKNAKHAQQWPASLRNYVFPKLGSIAVRDIDAAMVLKVVEPIWHDKVVTAQRVLNRIQRIMDYATASGFRSGDNPARHVAESLPKGSTIAKVEHFPSMPFVEVPQFMIDLRAQNGSLPAKALEFLILTGARAGMVIHHATWDSVDVKARIWIVPGSKMKKGKEHRTPLADRAIEILSELPRTHERIFPVGIHAMANLLKRLRPDASVSIHGFRASLTTWASERTGYPHPVIEQALAHAIPGATEKAYRRGDLFERRRKMMAHWATFVGTKPAAEAAGSTVVPMHAKVSANA